MFVRIREVAGGRAARLVDADTGKDVRPAHSGFPLTFLTTEDGAARDYARRFIARSAGRFTLVSD